MRRKNLKHGLLHMEVHGLLKNIKKEEEHIQEKNQKVQE